MQNNERITSKRSPCKVPNPCSDYRDYDPCESNENITDKDLAVLLKEEQAKLQREKDAAKSREGGQDGKSREGAQDGKCSEGAEGAQSGKDELDNEELLGSGKTDRKDQGADANKKKLCHREKNRSCRKLKVENPFFRNRLSFSSDLPPPPPVPPPQFFPLAEDPDAKPKVCKRKRKKKCKKKEADTETGMGGSDGRLDGRLLEGEEEFKECQCINEECLREDPKCGIVQKGRRRCKKPQRPPCRKKESDMSVIPQPRRIPAVQKDLPPTNPQDIPEVERQILMAAEKDRELNCPKKLVKKICEKL